MRHDESPHLAALANATASVEQARRCGVEYLGIVHLANAVESVIAVVRALADSPTVEPVEEPGPIPGLLILDGCGEPRRPGLTISGSDGPIDDGGTAYFACQDHPGAADVDVSAECRERWPEAASGEYNPACCRFPKSCSASPAPAEPVEGIRGDVGQPDPEPCPLDVIWQYPCRHVAGHDGGDCEPLLPDAAELRKAGALWALDQAFNRGDVSLWQLREDIVAGRVTP